MGEQTLSFEFREERTGIVRKEPSPCEAFNDSITAKRQHLALLLYS